MKTVQTFNITSLIRLKIFILFEREGNRWLPFFLEKPVGRGGEADEDGESRIPPHFLQLFPGKSIYRAGKRLRCSLYFSFSGKKQAVEMHCIIPICGFNQVLYPLLARLQLLQLHRGPYHGGVRIPRFTPPGDACGRTTGNAKKACERAKDAGHQS